MSVMILKPPMVGLLVDMSLGSVRLSLLIVEL